MPTNADGQAGDAASEPFEFADVDWGDDVLELSEQLGRLWRVAGNEKMAVGQMLDVRAGLFGYGNVTPED